MMNKAKIYSRNIGDYLSREEKLDIVRKMKNEKHRQSLLRAKNSLLYVKFLYLCIPVFFIKLIFKAMDNRISLSLNEDLKALKKKIECQKK
jgi:hypothetical protein